MKLEMEIQPPPESWEFELTWRDDGDMQWLEVSADGPYAHEFYIWDLDPKTESWHWSPDEDEPDDHIAFLLKPHVDSIQSTNYKRRRWVPVSEFSGAPGEYFVAVGRDDNETFATWDGKVWSLDSVTFVNAPMSKGSP